MLVPISLRQARAFVAAHHRHNGPDRGWRFGVGLMVNGEMVAVGVAGNPKARELDDGQTIEVTRCCTLGTANAASRIYGALNRAAKALGYRRSVTYTLRSEPGTSVRAAGYRDPAELEPRASWASAGRGRYDASVFGEPILPAEARVRWMRRLD